MRFSDISKKQAFLTHLGVSASVFVILGALVVFVWYPSYYFHLDGGYRGLATLFFVDVVIGPGLTLLVFKPGKPSLRFDMTIIILLQLTAMFWGIKSTWEDRSAVTVFYLGRFSCLSESVTAAVDHELKAGPGSQGLVLLRRPDSREAYSEFLRKAMEASSSEIYYYGDRFEKLGRDNVGRVEGYRLDLDRVVTTGHDRALLAAFRQRYPDDSRYRLLPLSCRFADVLAVFDTQDIRIVDTVDIGTDERAESVLPFW